VEVAPEVEAPALAQLWRRLVEAVQKQHPRADIAACWIDPNGRPTARDSVSGPLDPAP
jgi:hypothetical protein